MWVKPGAGVTRVGGTRQGALVVRVRAPATQGQANAAAIAALAEALGVPRSRVRLVSGRASRTKVLEVRGDEEILRRALAELATAG